MQEKLEKLFVLGQKRKKRKTAWKFAAEAVLLSRSEFKSQEYEQNSEHKSG